VHRTLRVAGFRFGVRRIVGVGHALFPGDLINKRGALFPYLRSRLRFRSCLGTNDLVDK
jgi:hypothetical protein